MVVVRQYGRLGYSPLIVLHGGPGAAGHMAPVARGLADAYRVFEPFQRKSGGEPLTVARHVTDLHDVKSSLAAYLPQLEYRELEQCGHYPWLEKATAESFFSLVREWLDRHLAALGK
jgi:pimeloyl-ACP methyl ester carboxylesterase